MNFSDWRSSVGGTAPCRRRRCGCALRLNCCCRPNAAAYAAICARALQPQRRKIDDPDALAGRQQLERPVQQRLCRVERVKTPRSGFGFSIEEAEAVAHQQHRLAHRRNDRVFDQQPLQRRIMLSALFGGFDDLPRVEAVVEDALRDELREAGEIDAVRRHAYHDLGSALRRVPIRPDVTGGAIQRDTIKAQAVAPRMPTGRSIPSS